MTTDTLAPQRRIFIPQPLPHQVPPLSADFRFKDIIAGRRWGKTKLGLISMIEGHGPWVWDQQLQTHRRKYLGALHGGHMLWIAPNYTVANTEIWPELKDACFAAWTDKSEENFQIDFPSGGFVRVRSAEKENSLRSTGYDGVVFDEHADIAKTVWTKVIRPALMDRRGWATFIGTPKGFNWAYDLWVAAKQNPRWLTLQGPSWDNPIITREEIEDLVQADDMSPADYAQEIEAQFVAAGGNLVKETWWRFYQGLPVGGFQQIGQMVDSAWERGTRNDYSVIATWGRTWTGQYYLLRLWRDRVDFPTLLSVLYRENAEAKAQFSQPFIPLVIENSAAGIPAIQLLRNPGMWNRMFGAASAEVQPTLLSSLPVIAWPDKSTGDVTIRRLRGERLKGARVTAISQLIKGGQVFLPGDGHIQDETLHYGSNTEQWVRDFIDEHSSFGYDERGRPLHRHDDQVDTTSMGLWWLSKLPQPTEQIIPFTRKLELVYR